MSLGDRPGVVGAGGVPGEEDRPLSGQVLDEGDQDVDHVVGALEGLRCVGLSHPGQVGIDPPKSPGRGQDRLEARLRLPVVDTGAVEYQHRLLPRPVDDVPEIHLSHP